MIILSCAEIREGSEYSMHRPGFIRQGDDGYRKPYIIIKNNKVILFPS